ncbi:hypothetical protein ENBRE01_3203 [Enteropsectra breve]|nr:hypothetical protein ENBRE01_3203 [Enteropsectra breve]
MGVERAKDTYNALIKTASSFLSPSIKSYFVTKARDEYDSLLKRNSPSEAEKYIENQKKLNAELSRVVGIYNTYRDNNSTL